MSDHISKQLVVEPQVLQRVLWRIMPLLAFSYFVSIIDRTNISFAALRMNTDLGIGPEAYGIAAGIFYAGYTLFEVPSNVLLLRFGPRRWFARIMISWGLLSMATGIVQNSSSLYVVRFLLGIAEAGLFPGMLYYLSQWIPQAYTGRVLGMLFVLNPISSAVGSPLSAWILREMGWQAMFVLEGAPAIVAGLLVWRWLPFSLESSSWLSEHEKAALLAELPRLEQRQQHSVTLRKLGGKSTWAAAAQLFLLLTASYGVQLWLPQIVRELAVPERLTGWVVAIPFGLSSIAMIAHGRSSDRLQERFWHLVLPCFVAAFFFAFATLGLSPFASLAALSLGTAGIFCAVQAFFAFPRASSGPNDAIVLATINALGNLGGFFGPMGLGYIRQHATSLAAPMILVSFVLALGGALTLLRGMPANLPLRLARP